jgi:protein-disulfide isomerase
MGRLTCCAAMVVTGWLGVALPASAADKPPTPTQDPAVLEFVGRALPWHPSSTLRIVGDEVRQTPSGSYRMLSVERSCASTYLSGTTSVVVDEVVSEAWVGTSGELPTGEPGFDLSNLRASLARLLPDILKQSMSLKVKVEWVDDAPSAALIPLVLRVDSGYGEYRKPAAVTADGKLLLVGARYPFKEDPVRFRRELLRASPTVVWDSEAADAKVEIVELSDFECPGCKAKWPLVKKVLATHGSAVRHGFVAFPLTTIHPWAFRAACAGWCVAAQKASGVLALKELFYSLQQDMEVAEVTPTTHDFVAANGLDQAKFDSCYLRQPSIDGVHDQMSLGNRLGVNATPTYFVNGWLVQVPEESWFLPMVQKLVTGQEP